MALQDYLALRNGTDVRGVVLENEYNEKINLTTEITENISRAFCMWLTEKTGNADLHIAVGYDSRLSSPMLCQAVINGIVDMGHTAVSTGLSTTPSMFMLLKDERQNRAFSYDGSIMITASHLPFHRNGLKFFTQRGGLDGEDVKEILTLAATCDFPESMLGRKLEIPYLDSYAETLVEAVRTACSESEPLKGKHIIVDAGNGVGGFYASKVLIPLGANVHGSQFLEPDGHFPNHIPNPENAEAMRSICQAVVASGAELGIIFDTDVDRAGAVDKNGKEINRNRLIALISAILLAEKSGTIVTDSVTSEGLTKFIDSRGGRHHRFKRGYKNVINEAIRLNEEGEYTPLAIETSGHAAFLENYFLDDGAYLVTRLLIALAKASKEGKSLTDLIRDLEEPKEAYEIRLRFQSDCDFKTLGAKILKDFERSVAKRSHVALAPDNYEGCRVQYDKTHGDGWALLRMSLHEPIMPINVESNVEGGSFQILKDVYYALRKYECLDTAPLAKIVEKLREQRATALLNALSSSNV